MTRLRLLLFVTATALSMLACQQKTDAGASTASADLTTDDQKTIYAIGLALSRELEPFELSEAELGAVSLGLMDGALGRPPQVDLEAQMPKIQELGMARVAAAAAEEATASEAFLTAAAAEPGAEKLETGLVFREIEAGTGASPKPTDTVQVHYHGTLRDGAVFDSSVDRGTPAEFRLDGVIPCWTQGVQKMKVGGKARLTCPASIAYGERGAPPKIKPGAALVFDVELIRIGAAQPAEQTPGQPQTGDSPAPKADGAEG